MAIRVWNFLLPASGGHCLRVTNLGNKTPTVELDGKEFPPQQARVFPGPDNSLLELQCINDSWSLLVNGVPVEEYTDGLRANGDETLRELRSKPDGSYTISPQFDASHLALNLVRKFRFAVGGNIHEVQISQVGSRDGIWQILMDGILVQRAAKFSDGKREILFTLCAASGVKLNAALSTRWKRLDYCWQIMLSVNGIEIPLCWSKAGGEVQPQPELPEVPSMDSAEEAAQQAEGEEEQTEEATEGTVPSTLPAGVSFDRTSGAYQATIRGKSGRYVFLGEFGTPEEAHEQYLMALQENC